MIVGTARLREIRVKTIGVVGCSRGFGRWLVEAQPLQKHRLLFEPFTQARIFAATVNCANRLQVDSSLAEFESEHLLIRELSSELLQRDERPIFISTLEVSALEINAMSAFSKFAESCTVSPYTISKMLLEHLYGSRNNALVIRPGLLVGREKGLSTLESIVAGTCKSTQLSAESAFHLTPYMSLADAILSGVLDSDLRGPIDLATSDSISLGTAAKAFERRVQFGSALYYCPSPEPSNRVTSSLYGADPLKVLASHLSGLI